MAATQYKVVGACAVAGVAPGGTVTRAQVEKFVGDGGHLNFEVLVGNHLEEIKPSTDKPADDKAAPAKQAAKP